MLTINVFLLTDGIIQLPANLAGQVLQTPNLSNSVQTVQQTTVNAAGAGTTATAQGQNANGGIIMVRSYGSMATARIMRRC